MAAAVALLGVGQGVVSPLPAPSADWLLLALGLSGAFLAGNLALQYGAARLAAHTTALIMLSEVLFASGSAVLLGAAELTGRTLTGGSLIVLAALLAAWPSRRAV
jgi:drug/metabolite transporter (DMT)-like permease